MTGDGPPRTVVAFPGAGSLGREFRSLRSRLPGGARLVTVRYPGRNGPDRLSLPEEATRSREGAWGFLTGIGEDVVGPVPGEEWRDLLMETAWQDLVLPAEFPGPARARLRCAVPAVRGRDDPLTAEERTSPSRPLSGANAGRRRPARSGGCPWTWD